MRDWTRRFFRAPVFSPDMAEAEAAAPREAAFLWKALRLKRGARVLDLACGTGRHARRLAKRGARVTGVDATPAYLAAARRAAGGTRYLRGDMRRLPFESEFDAAYNVWTSFGYFTPAEDLKVLRGIARALVPGGLFLIDVLDFAWMKRHFEPERAALRADGSQWVERARLRLGRDPGIDSEWLVLKAGRRPARAKLSVRGYDERRLRALLKKAGLAPLKRWGTLEGKRKGNRLVVLASRPAS